jgi:hypothetical protein
MRNTWYSFLEAESTPGHMVLSVATEKIPSDTTGDRSRDCPTSSAVHHQVVRSLILKQTIQYTMYFVFINQISYTSIKSAFKITTVAAELKIYSEIKDINTRP